MVYNCGYAVAYIYGDGLGFYRGFGHFQSHHAGLAVERSGGIEDEIAYAVVYLLAKEILDGLQCVGVVADTCIGAGT